MNRSESNSRQPTVLNILYKFRNLPGSPRTLRVSSTASLHRTSLPWPRPLEVEVLDEDSFLPLLALFWELLLLEEGAAVAEDMALAEVPGEHVAHVG